MPSDPKPHHRRAAAEALLGDTGVRFVQLEYPGKLERWVDDTDPFPVARVMCIPAANLPRVAQAIADAEERGRQEERARLLGDCKFFEVDVDGRFTEHDRLCDAESEAEASLEGALDDDSGWSEGTEEIRYGALVYLGRVVATGRSEAPEGSPFDELIEYTLKTTDAELGRELDKAATGEQPGRLIGDGK